MRVLISPGGPVQTNGFIVADDEGTAVVVDPGYQPARLVGPLQQHGLTVAAIVVTHEHFDHVAGNAEAKALWSAPLWMHPDAVPLATTAHEHAAWFGMDCEDSPPPDQTFAHGDTFTVGGLSFTIRHAPGHSPGSVCLVAPGHAFVGDVLFAGSIGRTDLPHSDHERLMRSIREELMTLPDDTIVYPGHGPTTTIGEERRHNPFRREWERS